MSKFKSLTTTILSTILISTLVCTSYASAATNTISKQTLNPSANTPSISSKIHTDSLRVNYLDYYKNEPYVSNGSSGYWVQELQRRLTLLGFFTVDDVDGIFGPYTEQCVKNFQASVTTGGRYPNIIYYPSIDADGIVGPQTWGKINFVMSL